MGPYNFACFFNGPNEISESSPENTSGFRVEGWTILSSQGFDPLSTQKVPLGTILRHSFLADLKFFEKPLEFQYILILKVDWAPEKNANFWSKLFKKCLNTPFLFDFSKICLRQRKNGQNVVGIMN